MLSPSQSPAHTTFWLLKKGLMVKWTKLINAPYADNKLLSLSLWLFGVYAVGSFLLAIFLATYYEPAPETELHKALGGIALLGISNFLLFIFIYILEPMPSSATQSVQTGDVMIGLSMRTFPYLFHSFLLLGLQFFHQGYGEIFLHLGKYTTILTLLTLIGLFLLAALSAFLSHCNAQKITMQSSFQTLKRSMHTFSKNLHTPIFVGFSLTTVLMVATLSYLLLTTHTENHTPFFTAFNKGLIALSIAALLHSALVLSSKTISIRTQSSTNTIIAFLALLAGSGLLYHFFLGIQDKAFYYASLTVLGMECLWIVIKILSRVQQKLLQVKTDLYDAAMQDLSAHERFNILKQQHR